MAPSLSLIINACDPALQGLLQSFNRVTPAAFPTLVEGNELPVTLRVVEPTNAGSPPWQDIDLTGTGATLTIATAAGSPVAFTGSFTLSGALLQGSIVLATPEMIAAFAATQASQIVYTAQVDLLFPGATHYRTIYAGPVKISRTVASAGALTDSPLAAYALAADLAAHEARVDNPHAVTKSQVGLANAENTADAAKPVSTAQSAADAAVQSYAVNRANHTGSQLLATISDAGAAAAKGFDTDGLLAANSDGNVPSQRAVKTYVDTQGSGAGALADAYAARVLAAGGTDLVANGRAARLKAALAAIFGAVAPADVIELFACRSGDNAGTGTTLYGLTGALNATLSTSTLWDPAGIVLAVDTTQHVELSAFTRPATFTCCQVSDAAAQYTESQYRTGWALGDLALLDGTGGIGLSDLGVANLEILRPGAGYNTWWVSVAGAQYYIGANGPGYSSCAADQNNAAPVHGTHTFANQGSGTALALIGSDLGGVYPLPGHYPFVGLFRTALTTSQMAAVQQAVRNYLCPDQGIYGANLMVCIGDSLTQGIGGAVNMDYPSQLAALPGIARRATWVNLGVSGSPVSYVAGAYAGAVYPLRQAITGGPVFYLVCSGTNDLRAGAAAADVYGALQAIWAQARASGFVVVAITLPKCPGLYAGNAAAEAQRQALNALMLGNRALADAFVDLSPMDDPSLYISDTGNAAYGHPTSAGYAVMAQAIGAQLNLG